MTIDLKLRFTLYHLTEDEQIRVFSFVKSQLWGMEFSVNINWQYLIDEIRERALCKKEKYFHLNEAFVVSVTHFSKKQKPAIRCTWKLKGGLLYKFWTYVVQWASSKNIVREQKYNIITIIQ